MIIFIVIMVMSNICYTSSVFHTALLTTPTF